MIILIKLFLNSKLDLIRTVKFVKQLFRIQIQKGRKVLLRNQVKSRIEACYSELVLVNRLNAKTHYYHPNFAPFQKEIVSLRIPLSKWQLKIMYTYNRWHEWWFDFAH